MTTPAQPVSGDGSVLTGADGPTPTFSSVTNTPSNLLTTSTTPAFTAVSQPNGPAYTAEDIERARKQEKDKLYPQLESLREELAKLSQEREERLAAEEAARKAAEEDARKKAEEETDVRSLLEQKQAEWQAQLDAERRQREEALAVLQREREYGELVAYQQQQITAHADDIIPDLLDMVGGNNKDEIDASIARLVAKSQSIIEAAGAAAQSQRQQAVGSRVTAPPVGPLDTTSDHQSQLSPQDIAAMPMSEYVKHRDKLMGASRAQRERGLFG